MKILHLSFDRAESLFSLLASHENQWGPIVLFYHERHTCIFFWQTECTYVYISSDLSEEPVEWRRVLWLLGCTVHDVVWLDKPYMYPRSHTMWQCCRKNTYHVIRFYNVLFNVQYVIIVCEIYSIWAIVAYISVLQYNFSPA